MTKINALENVQFFKFCPILENFFFENYPAKYEIRDSIKRKGTFNFFCIAAKP